MKNAITVILVAIIVDFLVLSYVGCNAYEQLNENLKAKELGMKGSSLKYEPIDGISKIEANFKSLQDNDYELNDLDKRHISSLLKDKQYSPNKRFFSTLFRDDDYEDDDLQTEKRHIASILRNEKRHLSSIFRNGHKFDRQIKRHFIPGLNMNGQDYSPYLNTNIDQGDNDVQKLKKMEHHEKWDSNADNILTNNDDLLSFLLPYKYYGNKVYDKSHPFDKRHYSSLLKNANFVKRHISSLLRQRLMHKRNENSFYQPQDQSSLELPEAEKRYFGSTLKNYQADTSNPYFKYNDQLNNVKLTENKRNQAVSVNNNKWHRINKRQTNHQNIQNTANNGNSNENDLKDRPISNQANNLNLISDEISPIAETRAGSNASIRKKRHIGSLARNGDFPFRPTRVIWYRDSPLDARSIKPVENPMNTYNSEERLPLQDNFERPDIYPSDAVGYFPAPQKRFLGSLARKTWFPRQYRSFLDPNVFNGGRSTERNSGNLITGRLVQSENYGNSDFIPNTYVG